MLSCCHTLAAKTFWTWRRRVLFSPKAVNLYRPPILTIVAGSVDNRVYTLPATIVSIGGRYKFTAFGENSTLRLQVQNVLAANVWQQLNTPGVFQWPGPRRVFAYITTDLQ